MESFVFEKNTYCWSSQRLKCQRCEQKVPELLICDNVPGSLRWDTFSISDDDVFTCIFCRLEEEGTGCMNCVAYGTFGGATFDKCPNCVNDLREIRSEDLDEEIAVHKRFKMTFLSKMKENLR